MKKITIIISAMITVLAFMCSISCSEDSASSGGATEMEIFIANAIAHY